MDKAKEALKQKQSQSPIIQLKGVTKRFGAVTAVDHIDLDIYPGELFCLLGGSGSGKSTLLRMLSGFESPSEGQIIIDGVDMAGVEPYERPVNMMFQSYALFPHMTVFDNIAYGLRRMKLSKSEVNTQVAELLHMVQLDDYAKRKPHQLSGGQRQRVALARALARRPKLLLLDEPLGALDKKLREETQFELVKIQEQSGVTFVVVTHDQEEAMTLADRIGVMDRGRIVQIGEPRDIYEYPNSRFVADFIGSVNLFDCSIGEEGEDFTILESADLKRSIRVGHGISGAPGSNVSYAIRPEKIALSRESENADNEFSGTIEDVAYMGNWSLYRVRLDCGCVLKVSQANLNRQDQSNLTWDDRVIASWSDTSGVVLPS